MGQKGKRNLIKHIVIIILLCIPTAFLWYEIIERNNSVYYKTETVTATEPCVYVTAYGERYHSSGCSYLSKSKIPMGMQEAVSKGYTACSRCGGKPNGMISVTYTKKIAVDGTVINICAAIGLAALSSPAIYLFIYFLVMPLIAKH